MANTYKQDAYDYAITQSWTPTQIRGASPQQVATACGITLDGDGNPPADFWYEIIKSQVANKIEEENKTSLAENRRVAIRDKVLQLAEMINATVEHVGSGDIVEGPCWVVRRNT